MKKAVITQRTVDQETEEDNALKTPVGRGTEWFSEEYIFKLYLKDIGQTPLLTREEERDLAQKFANGDQDAKERLIKANLRLVVKIAHDYEYRGVPFLDLVNEGNIGLIEGIERFDLQFGAKISTYAAWWIKQKIRRTIYKNSRAVRIPMHTMEKLSRLNTIALKLHREFGREATDQEIAQEMDMTLDELSKLRSAGNRSVSLQQEVGEDSETLADVIADPNAVDPSEATELSILKSLLKKRLSGLDYRELNILRYRYGLDDGMPMTLEEVGKKFKITRERVRQLQKIALGKLGTMINVKEPPKKGKK